MDGPLAIVGFMGSGKTTVGRALARALDRRFVDLDYTIAEQAGCGIPEIFAYGGEDHFRDLEHQALRDALRDHRRGVIACGGGVVVREENRALLRGVPTVFLREDLGVLYERTRGAGRPLRSASREEFERRYAKRLPLYSEVADLEVYVHGRPPTDVAGEVIRCLPIP